MAKKKKAKKKTGFSKEAQSRAEAWLVGLTEAPEEAWDELENRLQTDSETALAMVTGLGGAPSPEAGWVAHRATLLEVPKDIRKAAKKAVYQLTQKGIEIDKSESRSIFKAAVIPPDHAYLSGVHMDGTETLVLAFPGPGGEGTYGAASLSYMGGFEEVMLHPMRAVQYRTLVNQLKADQPWEPVKVEGEDLYWIIRSTFERSRELGEGTDEGQLYLAQWLGKNPMLLDHAPIYDRLAVDPDQEPGLFSESLIAEALQNPPCIFWAPEKEAWESGSEKLAEEDGSDLIVSADLERDRRAQKITEVIPEVFPENSRPAWKTRMESAALALEGSEPETAKAFLKAALLSDQDDNPVYIKLVERFLELEKQQAEMMSSEEDRPGLEDNEEPSGLILPPGVGGD